MRFKIFLLIFVLALGVLAYFAYPIVKNRYFNNAEPENNIILNSTNTNSKTNFDATKSNDTVNESEISASEEEVKDTVDETGVSANITASDCDNECADFKDNANNLKYCQDICDISPIKDSENCEAKQGSDKDYCFKNQAISKTDSNICNSITDSKIKSACKNRVAEDLLEQQ